MKIPNKLPLISLRYKIAIPFVILVFMIMASVTYIFSIREMKFRADQVKERMERLANNIATIRSVGSEDWNLYQSYIDNQIAINPDIVYIAIFNEFRELKAHVLNTSWLDISNKTLTDFDETRIIEQLEDGYIADESQKDFESVSVNILMGNQSRGYVHVGFSLIDINDELRHNILTNLGLGFLFTVLAIYISFFMSQKIVNPLTHLTKAMKQISEGDFNQQVPIRSHDEIGEMTQTFNFMTNGLREKVEIESFGRELGFTLEAERIFQIIVQRIAHAMQAKEARLFLKKNQEICEIYQVASFPAITENPATFLCSDLLVEQFKEINQPQYLKAFREFPDFLQYLKNLNLQESPSLICPIKVMDDMVGLLVLNGCFGAEAYSETQTSFLGTLIRQAGFALENILLLERLTEQERMKQELKIAGQVQQSLLPAKAPVLSGFDIHGLCLPATEIGGDYFDYFNIDNHHLGIAIADVTGKGTSAAFYMAVVKGLMLSLTRTHKSPKDLLCELNRRLYGIMDRQMFITMIYGVLNTKTRCMTFSRAGHNSLLIKNAQDCTVDCRIPEGIGLGLEKGPVFEKTIDEERIDLNQFQTILFYTDGIIETTDAQDEPFGETRLIQLMKTLDNNSAENMNHAIVNAVQKHAGQIAQHDDMTLVTLLST